jgi:hypothetical protein
MQHIALADNVHCRVQGKHHAETIPPSGLPERPCRPGGPEASRGGGETSFFPRLGRYLSLRFKIGDFVAIGGQAGFAEHVQVGTRSRIGAQSGVIANLTADAVVDAEGRSDTEPSNAGGPLRSTKACQAAFTYGLHSGLSRTPNRSVTRQTLKQPQEGNTPCPVHDGLTENSTPLYSGEAWLDLQRPYHALLIEPRHAESVR